jgi:hypothetical protein
MDGLEEFEKALAAEKIADSSKSERHDKNRERHHHHHHRSRHHKSRDEDDKERQHRHKRSRHSRTSSENDHLYSKSPLLDEEATKAKRDSWMVSLPEIEYTQRPAKVDKPAKPLKPDYDLKIHKNELNHHLQDLADGKSLNNLPDYLEVDYTFGDAGSQWRLTKLKAVYREAEKSGRPAEDVALERFGNLRDFDNAREEEVEMGRRELYGKGYVGKEKPSGELYLKRKMDTEYPREHKAVEEDNINDDMPLPHGEVLQEKCDVDATTLNRLRAQMMKAKLKGSPDTAKLEEEYNKAASSLTTGGPTVVTLGVMNNRMLAGSRGEVRAVENRRGRERGLVVESEEMSIEDMVREERQTRGQAGGEGQRFASRIAKDGKFDASLDYMDENAEKLAKRVHKSETNLKNAAISEYRKTERILDNCPLCHHEEKNQAPAAPIISLATRVYLTLPTEPELSEGGAVIVPIQHHLNLLECDEDEWEEIRNFMKCLTRMYHDQGRDVIFYENAAAPQRKLHAAMQAVPLPYSLGETAPAFFKEAILASDEEWTQHKKLIDTASGARNGLGKNAFRRSIAKEMPYFHVWFEMDGGLGHIVEDSNRWPKGDLFVREIVGGMLDLEPDVIKRQGRWTRGVDRRSEGFKKRWRKFDWTRVLTEGQ